MNYDHRFFQEVTDVEADRQVLQKRAYGVIEVCDQQLKKIRLRPFPKLISLAEIRWADFWKNQSAKNENVDRVLIYYNQPMLHRNFLALKYFVSDHRSSPASIAVSLSVLDYIAMVKGTDAIVTEVTNERIKDRHLAHFGWEQHMHESRSRHWIKRYYGQYPAKFLFLAGQQSANNQRVCNSAQPEIRIPVIVTPRVDSNLTDQHHVRIP